MRKIIYLTALQCLIAFSGLAQGHIDSFTVIPANPKHTDTVKVLAHCWFSSMNCDLRSSAIDQALPAAIVTHCIGMLTAICYRTDTFTLLPRPAGNYHFRLMLFTGAEPNCDMVTVTDLDSVAFTVAGGPTTIPGPDKRPASFTAVYNRGAVEIHSLPAGFGPYQVQITSMAGTLVAEQHKPGTGPIPIELSSGVYLITVRNGQERLVSKLLVQ